MELKHVTKQLNEKRNQQTSSDDNYQKCKQDETKKGAAVHQLKVCVRPQCQQFDKYLEFFFFIFI